MFRFSCYFNKSTYFRIISHYARWTLVTDTKTYFYFHH